jgi:hypothetical protein
MESGEIAPRSSLALYTSEGGLRVFSDYETTAAVVTSGKSMSVAAM